MDVYIKLKKNLVTNKKNILLEDIAQIISEDTRIPKILILKEATKTHPILAIDIISEIRKLNKSATVNIIGTDYMVIEKKGKETPKFWGILKVFFISLILFTGCVTAIVTFHTETSLGEVFNIYAKTFSVTNMAYLYVPYALGIGVGIVVFFNHAFSRKFTLDPTPIEVEMNTYQTEIIDAVVESLEK